MSKVIKLSFWMLFVGYVSYGQTKTENLITGNFSNLTFKKFADQVQIQTSYRFYYSPGLLDSLIVNTSAQERKVEDILDEIFREQSIDYAIDAQNHIYVVGREIQASLPPDFFNSNKSSIEAYNKALLDYLDIEKKEKSRLQAENRQYDIGKKTSIITKGNATIAGHVKSSKTGEPIIGASVFIENPLIGVTTDQFGYFALIIPKGKNELNIKSVGMKGTKRNIILYSDGKLDIELEEDVTSLREVVIESDRDRNVSGMQMGLDRLDMKTMKKIPVVLGEVDILKVMLTLPGVQTVGEGTTGLNVRGGAADQNLILFGDAVIYNPSHLFGFFSAFNPDAVKNVELYKSGIPAEYGGRVSSVLDVTAREGNKKKFSGSGGIGPVTSRLTLEGPIIKDKTSFLVGARSTYSDWLLKKIPSDALKHSEASFYDFNANINHEINDKNTVYLSGYLSKDRFRLDSDTLYSYRNKALTAKWRHNFSNKLYGVLTTGFSGYDYDVTSDKNPVTAFTLKYGINQVNLKADFSYFPFPKHSFNAGASTIRYSISPGSYLPKGENSEVERDVLSKERGIESAIYIGDHYDISQDLSVYGGIRYSLFSNIGPHDTYVYAPGQTRTPGSIVDTVSHGSGKSIATYHGPEFRVSVKYALASNASLKFSYNRTRQYIQMLSNTTAISPTDIWKLSDTYMKPQIGDQVSLGFYKNFRSNTIETSVEGYYKTLDNAIDYKSGATLVVNHTIETDIVNAKGKAYGIEVMVKKMSGKINGWISYAYSRSLLKTKSIYDAETVNKGKYYPSNYDKPHAINLIGNYKFSHRYSTSWNFTYSTGRPITLPIAKYYIDGAYRVVYGPRNGSRIPDYFRIDFSLNIEGNHKIKKLAHSSWTIGVYNLLGRRNAYSVFFDSQGGKIKGYKLSVLGSAIPTVTYNFKF